MSGGRAVAVAWSPHHLDHLAPLAAWLGATIVSSDEPMQSAAAACYPDLDVRWVHGAVGYHGVDALFAEARALAPGVVLYSDLFTREKLALLLGGPDAPRVVYVPHGFSEKRQDWAARTADQDVACFPGRYAADQFLAYGCARAPTASIVTGHLRRRWYHEHRAHFDARVAPLGLGDGRTQPTVLYAPTWQDAIGSSSFFSAFSTLVARLPRGWRLVVKLHPHAERDAGALDALTGLARGRDVVLVRNHPLTLPLLQAADAAIFDMSALAYDYLALDRPMVFLNRQQGGDADHASSRLFACGEVLPPERYGEAYEAIARQRAGGPGRYGPLRAALDRYVHADERSPVAVVDELRALGARPAPDWLRRPA